MLAVWIVIVLASVAASIVVLAQIELHQDEKRDRLKREAQLKEREKNRNLRDKIRTNNYPEGPLLDTQNLERKTTGSKVGDSALAWLDRKPLLEKLVPKTPSIVIPQNIYDDFDSLNYPKLRGLNVVSEGDVGNFPYRTIDFTSFSMWADHNSNDDLKPTHIYLLQNSASKTLKIGITALSSTTDRIAEHKRNGWSTIHVWTAQSNRIARNVESSVLRWWRSELGAPAAMGAAQMPQGGYTETIELRLVSADQCVSYVNSLLSDVGLERIHSPDSSPLPSGSIIEGPVVIEARTRWSGWIKMGRGKKLLVVAEKLLVSSGSNRFVLELLRDAYRYQVPATASLGSAMKIRGRVQFLGDCRRVTNPWIFSPNSDRTTRPEGRFDLCG